MSLEPSNTSARWALSVGLLLTLLISAVKKFVATDTVTSLFGNLLGFSAPALTIVVAVILLIAGIMIVVDWQRRIAAGFLSLFFLVTIISGVIAGGPLFTAGPAIWKDFALLGASLALFYME